MTDIRTLSQQELDSMSLEDACRAIQARYTPEEWERMAHTTAVTFTVEEIINVAEPVLLEKDIEINGQSFHIVGRNADELEQEARYMHERYQVVLPQAVLSTAMWREPCRRCHLVHTLYRDKNNYPLCQGCALLQEAWEELQAVPAYVEREVK